MVYSDFLTGLVFFYILSKYFGHKMDFSQQPDFI